MPGQGPVVAPTTTTTTTTTDRELDVDDPSTDDRRARPDARPSRRAAARGRPCCLQVALFPHLRLAGRVPDLGLDLAVAVAFDHGPEAGALVGFLAGLGYDLFLETPLGLTALAYALTAYAVGVLQGGVLRSPKWFTPVIGGASGLAAGCCSSASGLLAGVGGVHGNQAFVTVGIAVALRRAARPVRVHPRGVWLREPRRPASPGAGRWR